MPIKDPEKRKEAQQRATEKRQGQRARFWACVVYPDSAPQDWVDRLNDGHVPTFISPLHDRDVTAKGEPKKAHWHVLAMFDQPVPPATAKEYFALAGVTAPPEKVRSGKAYSRYLIHLDDHDKEKYSPDGVHCLAGADWYELALGDDVEDLLSAIEDWIDQTQCLSYRALCGHARKEHPEWMRVVRRNTIHLNAYLRSAQWEMERIGYGGAQDGGSSSAGLVKGAASAIANMFTPKEK